MGFVPGTHDPKFFDTFLEPIVEDLSMLERGCFETCADGKRRKLRVFVLFVTADYPAARKLLGFMGHTSSFPCRYCHKMQTHVPEIGSRALVPTGGIAERTKAISSSRNMGDFTWLDLECARPRSDKETRNTWRLLDAKGTATEDIRPVAKKKLRSSTGISRRPILGRLKLDLVHSLPYDPMHLVFLGWVKHLLRLLFGFHVKTTYESTYVISETHKKDMNRALADGARGIPGCWGRASESLEHMATFKAEDFKNFGLFYGPILFSGQGVSQRISRLWGITSNIIHITCDPSPALEDVEVIRQLLQEAHALFAACFHLDANHLFCFTPNTHCILHLGDMLWECGPLPNVSQFTVERLIGDVGKMIGSMARPEAILFHKTHKLFSYRLLSGGMTNLEEQTSYIDWEDTAMDEEYDSDDGICDEEKKSRNAILGSGVPINNLSKQSRAQEWIQKKLGDAFEVEIVKVSSHVRARVRTRVGYDDIVLETETNFRERSKKAAYSARQKFWIAAHFREDHSIGFELDRNTKFSDLPDMEVYYGRVSALWDVRALVTNTEGGNTEETRFVLTIIDWQYGISIDRQTGMMFVRNGNGPRRGSVRHVERTIEEIGCVDRLIGIFEFRDRKYFMDPQRWRLINSSCMVLKGFL